MRWTNTMMCPQLSIVLVSWNTADLICKCIRSILLHQHGMELEIIVVDNASSDDTLNRIRNEFPAVRVIPNAENVGFGRACNQGMRAASSDLILLLNSDTYVVDDAIPKAVELINERAEFGMLSCQLRSPNGDVQRTTRRNLSIRYGLVEDLCLYQLLPRRTWGKLMLAHFWDHSEELEVDCVMGAFMLLRRRVFVESGGFHEDFFMYGEDQEWCMRLRAAGTRILYSPVPVIFHVGAASSFQTWTHKELIRRSIEGDVRAYSMINGPV